MFSCKPRFSIVKICSPINVLSVDVNLKRFINKSGKVYLSYITTILITQIFSTMFDKLKIKTAEVVATKILQTNIYTLHLKTGLIVEIL